MDRSEQSPRRILVSDFDSVHQASVWRTHGATEGTTRLISALRTAILLGDELTIDRNQLFDGIFFLTLGPAGVAAALGLSPVDKLPITVTCQPGRSEDLNRFVPALRGAPQAAGYDVSVDFQLQWVRSDHYRTASSALMAAWGETVANGWLCEPPREHWVRGAGLTRFHTPLDEQERVIAMIEAAQDDWADAMVDGRVAVDRWDRSIVDVDLDVQGPVRELTNVVTDQGIELRPLAHYILEQDSNVRKVVTTNVYEWTTEHPDLADEEEARIAMEMWSKAYYQAIARRDGNLYLSFYDGIDDTPLSRSYGLTLPVRSRYQRLKDRAFTSRYGETIRVEGEILDKMLVISPGSFAQLYLLTRDTAKRLIDEQDPQAMYDLAYASREAVNEPDSHAVKRLSTLRRIFFTTLAALVIAGLGLLTDLTDLSGTSQAVLIITAAILGIIAGLPWDDMREFFRLRKNSMTATLTLSNDRG